ncbi:MAG: RNA 3'-terminal phosphate cyclase [Lentisphaeria bacterium]|nr:RNA 3'-terminal phosphate cyclase [Lentisphaeria bacterium]
MIEIDGTHGEGGGQILRTSLSLAALTGETVHITRIRAGRRKPGLMRQHLTCVKAAAEITGGTLSGAELNSQEITFTPGKIRAGEYHFTVGTAGSAVLIAQTVIPALLAADGVSHVVIEGGTHADNAPIYDFFAQVYLPALGKMGAEVTAELEAVGFYPAGGGRIRLEIHPVAEWKRFDCMEAGSLRRATLTALGHDIEPKILTDEIELCSRALAGKIELEGQTLDPGSAGPGNVLFAKLEYEHITELFSVCGGYEIPRRQVSERVAGLVDKYLTLGAPVGRFLADQLLLPMSIGAGGRFLSQPPTKHTTTNIDVIRQFLPVTIELENCKSGTYIIEVKK